MHFVRSPFLLSKIYHPDGIWNIQTAEKVIYLTFDDGPVQDVTPWVLETLARHNARATFFCVGENVVSHAGIFNEILSAGHAVGNHTYNHLNGWKCGVQEYVDNVNKCSDLIPGNLFRPPYGRLRRNQLLALRHTYSVVFWSVLPGDFDQGISPERCSKNAVRHAGPGSVVVFHDSLKAFRNLRVALPAFLDYFSSLGYVFSHLPASAVPEKRTKTAPFALTELVEA
jgi:peptidoglycan-N-acetylglucosamine deacetylase